jgi:hypothetical protein
MLDKSVGWEKMEIWEMEMHVPFSNDLFSFPTSLARSGTSEVYFFEANYCRNAVDWMAVTSVFSAAATWGAVDSARTTPTVIGADRQAILG